MTTPTRLERSLPSILGDLAAGQTPDYIDDVLSTTAQRRQRPSWTFPERWLPMAEITSRSTFAPRLPWRTIAVAALLLSLAVGAAIYVGTHQRRVPAPFGPAANGLIAESKAGDLYTVDPGAGTERLLLGGPTTDQWISFTRDGTASIFFRQDPARSSADAGFIGVTSLDGSSPVLFESLPVSLWEWVESAPNGRDLAIQSIVDGRTRISLVAIDGSRVRTFDDVAVADGTPMGFVAPDGRDLVFATPPSVGSNGELRALDTTTGQTRTIASSAGSRSFFGNFSISPDGRRIAYAIDDKAAGTVKVHLTTLDGTSDEVIGDAGATFEAWPQWSPDGNRLLIERGFLDGATRPVVLNVASGTEVVVDTTISHNGAGKEWAPDGSAILAQRTAEDGSQLQQELWDVTSGAVRSVAWPSTSAPAWQRVAP